MERPLGVIPALLPQRPQLPLMGIIRECPTLAGSLNAFPYMTLAQVPSRARRE